MSTQPTTQWSAPPGLTGPGRPELEQWLSVPDCKRVLVVVHTLTYGQRLFDVFPLLEADLRIQCVFTVPPHPFREGVAAFLRALGAPVLPWDEAVRTRFDLALAAGSRGVHRIDAPVVRLSHGAGHIKLLRTARGSGDRAGASGPQGSGGPAGADGPAGVSGAQSTRVAGVRPPGMLSRGYLTRDGTVVPAALGLAHRDDLAVLERGCPEALPVASVVGDPAYDRLAASLPHRSAYRDALGLRAGQRLVVVTSTWGRSAAFPRWDGLLPRLVEELPPPEYRIALLTHPNIWAGHGWWQVGAWLAAHRRRGVAVVPPETDWRALLAAADWVVGDHGSLTAYASLTHAPILLARYPHAEVHPDSPAAVLARTAPALSPSHPLRDQLRYAATEYRREEHAAVAARITSEPGRFNRNMRTLMYRLLGIGRPAHHPATEPAPLPEPLETWTGERRRVRT